MRRNNQSTTAKGRRKTRAGGGAAQATESTLTAAKTIQVDDAHNGHSPSVRRLREIATQEIGFWIRNANQSTTAAPTPGWPTLVREYLLWVRPTRTPVLTTENLPKATTKKKRKKKKKKKTGTTAAPAQEDAAEGGEDAGTAEDEEENEDEVDRQALVSEEKETATTTNVSSVVLDTLPSTTESNAASTLHFPPSIKSKDSWIDQRPQRRRAWVDRFLEFQRQKIHQSSSEAGTTPEQNIKIPPPEQIQEQIDKFLSWLSDNARGTTPGSVVVDPTTSINTSMTTATGTSNSSQHDGQRKKNGVTTTTTIAGLDAPLSLSDSLTGGDTPPLVHYSIPVFKGTEAQQAIDLIQCLKCRERVSAQLSTRTFVLSGTQEADDRDVTFQYLAMEEGTRQPCPPHVFILMGPSEPTGTWRLERGDGKATVWTREALEFWLHEYVLFGGLGYDEIGMEPVMMGPTLTEETTREIMDQLELEGAGTMDELSQCARILEEQLQKIQSLKDSGDNIDMKNPPIMFAIESEFSSVMEKLMRVVLEITRAYQQVALYHYHAAHKLGRPAPIMASRHLSDDQAILHLWDLFLLAIQKILHVTTTHEESVIAMAQEGQQGQIPHLFYNATARKAMKELLFQKFKIVHSFLGQVGNSIDDPSDTVETITTIFKPSFSRSVRAAFALLRSVVPNFPQRKTPLDDACEDILYILREWTDHLRQNQVSRLMEEHDHRRAKLSSAMGLADHIMQKAKAQIEQEKAKPDARFVETLYQSWERRDLSKVIVGDMKTLRDTHELVVSKTGAMLRLWLKLSTARPVESESFPSTIVSMPGNIIQWITFGRALDNQREMCDHGAISRCGCILSSLLFDWMSRRYGEWQAEIAGLELLTAVGQSGDSGTGAWSHVPKAGSKKTAKKKDKKTVVASKPQAVGDSVVVEKSAVVPDEDTSDDDVLLVTTMSSRKNPERDSRKIASQSQPSRPESPTKIPEIATATKPQSRLEGSDDPTINEPGKIVLPRPEETITPGTTHEIENIKSSSALNLYQGVKPTPDQGSKSVEEEQGGGIGKLDGKTKIQYNLGKESWSPMGQERDETVPRMGDTRSSVDLDRTIEIGVFNGSGYQSAQEFLLARFVEVMKEANGGGNEKIINFS